MRRLALVVVLCLAGCGGDEKLSTTPTAPRQPQVSSPDFASGAAIPKRFSCQAEGARPTLPGTGPPAGAHEGGWKPPCPPEGTHRYEFRVYWLKAPSGLDEGASPVKLAEAIREQAGGDGVLVGHYAKR